MEKIRIKNYTEVFVADYPFHKELREEIVPILEQYPDKQDMKTNVKATHTEWDWYSDNPRIKRLKECMLAQAGSWCEYSYIGERNTALYFINFWGNVYRKGNYTQKHNHLPAQYSVVYFLKTKWYDSPLVMTDFKEKIRPKEGRYVIFPAHLKHHVPKHRYNDTRMTLSGNLRIKDWGYT